jgi:two-component system, LytTR family, response regulator
MNDLKIKTIVVDDEFYGRENLKVILERFCPQVQLMNIFEKPQEAIAFLEGNKVDLIFLDISMPEINGLDFAELYPDKEFEVIYITAYKDFALRALKIGAIDYLLKPISVGELQTAIRKVSKIVEKKNKSVSPAKKINISHSKGTNVVDINSIVYLESDGYLTTFHLDSSEKLVVSKNLKNFEDILPASSFFRIHRSFMVNLYHIESFSNLDGGYVKLKQSRQLPISRRKKNEFMQVMKSFSI